ncbi:hypothetical protein CVV38_01895 [Candidatus Peregrinibacteria bacterium HGW-Peregrinibacteria-1]|nr:MAG: hypothetical protein CVV38_01895 [Candidatus Peregrinibacteria bacterium HGW-Peregrinibacteria-1]
MFVRNPLGCEKYYFVIIILFCVLVKGAAIFAILILLSAIKWAAGDNLILFGTVSISPAGNCTSDLAF